MFRLRVKEQSRPSSRRRLSNTNNSVEAKVQHRIINERAGQLEAPVKYCEENRCKGHLGFKSGLFPTDETQLCSYLSILPFSSQVNEVHLHSNDSSYSVFNIDLSALLHFL